MNKKADDAIELLYKCFPEDERRDKDEIINLLECGDMELFTKYDKEDLLCFSLYRELGDVIFVEYLAVNSEHRNSGIGSRAVEELKGLNKMICLEVEPPCDDITRRRIEFYKRHGFFYNDYFYMQPALSEERSPVELRLMTTDRALSRKEFESLKDHILKTVYKDK